MKELSAKDKELLVKDLSARVPYGVIVAYKSQEGSGCISLGYGNIGYVAELGRCGWWIDCKPYLRSKDDMTEEELKTYHNLCYGDEQEILERGEWVDKVYYYDTYESIDYLNSIHVDYRYLIEKDLAIKVTKDNNPYKNE